MTYDIKSARRKERDADFALNVQSPGTVAPVPQRLPAFEVPPLQVGHKRSQLRLV